MRYAASRIVAGDEVTVYAFPKGRFHAAGEGTDARGVVTMVETIDLPYTTYMGKRITFESGRTVDAIQHGVTTFHERHPARPDDDNAPGDHCKDCGEDITWIGPSQYNWDHVNEIEEVP